MSVKDAYLPSDQPMNPNPRQAEGWAMSEHRWPKKDRATFPTRWLTWYSWRQFVAFTPKLGLRSLMVTLRCLPHGSWLLGLSIWRDEEEGDAGPLCFAIGLLVVEVEVHIMRWLSKAQVEALYG